MEQKVIMVSGFTPSLINFRKDLLIGFKQRGFKVIACGPDRDESTIKQLEDLNIDFRLIHLKRNQLSPGGDLKTVVSLSKLLKQEKPTHIFLYTIKPVILGSLAAGFFKKARLTSMITGLGFIGVQSTGLLNNFLKVIVNLLYKKILKNNDLILFQNPDDAEYFIQHHPAIKNKVNVINGSGVDLNYYYQTFFAYNNDEPIIFLMMSRLIKSKGFQYLIDAGEILYSKYKNFKIQLLGAYDLDSPDSISKEQIEQWQKKPFLFYLGQTRDVRDVLSNCSVYVLPTYYKEGTPRSILEAMSMSKPVITTNTPGCKETVLNGTNGFLIPSKSADELAKAMEYFIINPNRISDMGKASRKLAEKKYDVEKVNASIFKLLHI